MRGIFKFFEKEVWKNDRFGNHLVAFAGELVVMVDPDYTGRGVGTKLLQKALSIWEIDFLKQRYTPSGAAFVNEFLRGKQ